MDSFTIVCDKMFVTEDGTSHFIEAMFSEKFALAFDLPEILIRIHPAKKTVFDHLLRENQETTSPLKKNAIKFNVNKSTSGSETISYSRLTNVTPKKIVREIEIENFDFNANPVIRQIDTGSLRIVFCNLPPISFMADTEFDMNDFGSKLLKSSKAKIIWEDRDVFFVSNPYPETIDEIQQFVENYGGGKSRHSTISRDKPVNCKQAIAYLKASDPHSQPSAESITLALESTSFIDHLNTYYVVDEPQGLVFIQDHHLETENISSSTLREIGLKNLRTLFQQEFKVKKMGDVNGIFVDGNFEASGLLIDELWDQQLRSYVSHSFVAAVPSRDVLAFCDSQSIEGIKALKEIIRRVHAETENPNHLLSKDLYQRIDGRWVTFNSEQAEAQKKANDNLQQRLRANADKLCQLVKEKLNVDLNFDAKSFAWSNAYINKLSEKSELKNKESLIQLLAAFSGECFIQSFGGKWITQQAGVVVTIGDRTINPFHLVRLQMDQQLFDHLSIFQLYEAEALRDQTEKQKRTHDAAVIPRLDANTIKKYLLTPPPWIAKDPLKDLFDHVESLLQNGRTVWGTVIQANTSLFEIDPKTGLIGAPAELLYDPRGNCSIEDMLPISNSILQLRSTKVADHDLQFIKDHLNAETTRLFGHAVPASLSSKVLRMSTTWIERSYFPHGVIALPYFPILISSDYPGLVLPVPSAFWSEELKDQWVSRIPISASSQKPQRYIPPAEMAHLGLCSLVEEGATYFIGEKIVQDYEKARLAFEKAALQGNIYAYDWLAKMYDGGFGVQKNAQHAATLRAKAKELIQMKDSNAPRAAANKTQIRMPETALKETGDKLSDDPAHQLFLDGQAFYQGIGQIKSISKARAIWKESAKMGHRDSMYNLGCLYFNGEFTKLNRRLGLAYFEEAAKRGCKESRKIITERRRTLLGIFEWRFRKKNLFEE